MALLTLLWANREMSTGQLPISTTGSGSAISTGTYASLPGTCAVGAMYVFTDSVYDFAVCRATNVWTLFLDGKIAVPPGIVSSWTAVNGAANFTATDASGSINLQVANNASLNWRGLFKAQPSTPYTASYAFCMQQMDANASTAGAYFYDGTKWMGIEFIRGTTYRLRVEKITNSTTDSSTPAQIDSFQAGFPAMPLWYLRLGNTGANLTFSWSVDGIVWNQLFTEAVGTFLTPTHYGFGGICLAGSSNNTVTMSMRSIVLA